MTVTALQMRHEVDQAREVYRRAEVQGWERIPPHELMAVTVKIMDRCLTMMEACYAIAQTAEHIGIVGKDQRISSSEFQLALAAQGFMTRIIAAVIAAAIRGGLIQAAPDKIKLTSEDLIQLIAEMGEQLAAQQPPPQTSIH